MAAETLPPGPHPLIEASVFGIKQCPCCGSAFTHAEWKALEFVGIQSFDGDPEELELRNCPCGSTIAVTR